MPEGVPGAFPAAVQFGWGSFDPSVDTFYPKGVLGYLLGGRAHSFCVILRFFWGGKIFRKLCLTKKKCLKIGPFTVAFFPICLAIFFISEWAES